MRAAWLCRKFSPPATSACCEYRQVSQVRTRGPAESFVAPVRTIVHDLEIYRDLGYIDREVPLGGRPA